MVTNDCTAVARIGQKKAAPARGGHWWRITTSA